MVEPHLRPFSVAVTLPHAALPQPALTILHIYQVLLHMVLTRMPWTERRTVPQLDEWGLYRMVDANFGELSF